jgi:peptide/nickel transport system substrate-binding protein
MRSASFATIFVLAASTFFVGIAPARAADPQTLVYGRGMDSLGLDPAHESDGESFKVCDNLYETLVRFEDGGTGVEPHLAEKWSISKDGRDWEFTLRKGVQFHCGEPLNAAAVAYSLERQWGTRQPLHPAHGVGGPYPVWGYLGLDEVIEKVKVEGERKIRFRLREPCAPLLSHLASNFAAIVCPKDADRAGEDFFRQPCGTGPFQLVSWVPAESITLSRFEKYWGKAPRLDRVVFRSVPESSERFFELISGKIDVMDGIPPRDMKALQADPSIEVLGEPGMNVAYLAMNLEHEPFENELVRRAINHAVDKKEIVASVYGGLAIEAQGPLPPTVFAALPEPESYPHNPELAKSLLAEAGYPEGFETTLWTMANPRPYMPEPLRVAQSIQTQLAQVGVRAKIVSYDWGDYLDRIHRGHHDLALLGWQADSGDPDNFLYVHFDKTSAEPPAGNIAFYRGERVHELLLDGRRAMDPKDRLRVYREAQEIIHRDAPWVPLVHTKELAAHRKTVQGFRLHPTGRVLLASVWNAP